MGATVAGLRLGHGWATVFNCGDSRVYRFRNERLALLSRDHSGVFYLYLAGLIRYEDIRAHPMRRFVTGAVKEGASKVELYTKEIIFKPGDLYLICSDGVWENLGDGQIEKSLSGRDPLVCAEELASLLKAGEASDDFSFIICLL
jgi:serine/threonine protein phosphatase PrpC